MDNISVAGLKINTYTKRELLQVIEARMHAKRKTFLVTPYSEFLHRALHRPETMELLNSADLSIADGVGILWAQYFLSRPFSFTNYYLKIAQAAWQVVYTGASILLSPHKLYGQIPEKIVGADLVWDIAALAERSGFTLYLLGARGSVTAEAANVLRKKYPSIKIVGTSNKEWTDPSIVADITAAAPDMVLVAFNPPNQEKWIKENLPHIPAIFSVGLGGTFDYITGHKKQPPAFVRSIGLEWLYRLVTQPHRVGRIYTAVWGLIVTLVRYKVYISTGYRLNAAAVVVNEQDKVLVCKRVPALPKNRSGSEVLNDYWQFPQGGLDDGETLVSGAARELQEETGIESVNLIGVAEFTNHYDWKNGARRLLLNKYPYRGQEQQTVFFRFIGENSEIKLDQHELIEYQWLSFDEALSILAPERKPHAIKVFQELHKLI